MARRAHIWQTVFWCLVASLAHSQDLATESDYSLDDECLAGEGACALSALQRRARKTVVEENSPEEECLLNDTYFAEPRLEKQFPMTGKTATLKQCQELCAMVPGCRYFGFWHDTGKCVLTGLRSYPLRSLTGEKVTSGPKSCSISDPGFKPGGPDIELKAAEFLPYWKVHETGTCKGQHAKYALDWAAQGKTFFDQWQFLTTSFTHGSEWYLNKTEAFRLGLVRTSEESSILRVGDVIHFFKRHSVMLHSAQAWRPDKGFIVALKYKHVPYGLGIWPSFWTVNSDYTWPIGGELDIMEYANDDEAKVSFHTDQDCHIDARKMNECMKGVEHAKAAEETNCKTNYTSNEVGCIPKQVPRGGKWYAQNPGVIAMAWDGSRVAVYHIPEKDIPADLHADEPEPDNWQKWLTAYLPFDGKTCQDIAKPQEIVLTIALCGDAAGGPWRRVKSAKATGWEPDYCWPGHINEPATDCCTKYMTDPAHEHQIKNTSYFEIDYLKVYVPKGENLPKYAAGTYRNNGKPMNYPCLACGSSVFFSGGQSAGAGGEKCCAGCGKGEMKWDDKKNGSTKVCPSKEEYIAQLRNLTEMISNGDLVSE